MATKKMSVSVQVKEGQAFPIRIWVSDPEQHLADCESVEGVAMVNYLSGGPIFIIVDPHYDVQEVAAELEELLTAEVPDVFREN